MSTHDGRCTECNVWLGHKMDCSLRFRGGDEDLLDDLKRITRWTDNEGETDA